MASDQLKVEVVDESGSRPAVDAVTNGRDFQARLAPGTYTVTAGSKIWSARYRAFR